MFKILNVLAIVRAPDESVLRITCRVGAGKIRGVAITAPAAKRPVVRHRERLRAREVDDTSLAVRRRNAVLDLVRNAPVDIFGVGRRVAVGGIVRVDVPALNQIRQPDDAAGGKRLKAARGQAPKQETGRLSPTNFLVSMREKTDLLN